MRIRYTKQGKAISVKTFLRKITPLHILYRILINDIDIIGYVAAMIKRQKFILNGKVYQNFIHLYNNTFNNERCIEISAVRGLVELEINGSSKTILEVGNVLSHYFPFQHDVVDKYEKMTKVINEDIIEFKPQKRYDVIISISTFEHIGFDDEVIDTQKSVIAYNHLKELLNQNGTIVITMPIGYNPNILLLLEERKFDFTEIFYLKRISRMKWIESTYDEVKEYQYNYPYKNGNAIVIGLWKNGKAL